jgi:hypothetical protein
MNKKNIIIGALVATITFCVGCNEAEAQEEVVVQKNWQFDTEVGYYEKRMSGGLYGAQDAAYVKASTKLGNFKGLSFVGSLEYVNADEYELHSTIGTYINTPIGGIDTRLVVHNVEDADTTFELNGAYDLNWFDTIDTSITVSVEDGTETGFDTGDVITTPAFNVSKTFAFRDTIDITIGGEYGQSFGFDDDYEYTNAYLRLATVFNDKFPVFVQLNALNNNLNDDNDISSEGTDSDWDTAVTVGLAYSF